MLKRTNFVDARELHRHPGWRRGAVVVAALVTLAVLGAPVAPAGAAQTGAAAADRSAVADNSADRIVVWTSCAQLVRMTDANLDEWRDRGVRGFACDSQFLVGRGGANRFTGDLSALDGDGYGLERALRDTRIVERAGDRGIQLYLGFYFASAVNSPTPLADWFDDTAWKRTVLPAVRGLAAAARALGFVGITFDQELYPTGGGEEAATWTWNYPGNTRTEQAVRAQARKRGRQMMRAIVGAFPDVTILAYDTKFPETWDERIQQEINGVTDAFADWVQIDFWDGLTSVDGYGAIYFLNATFYKTPHVGTWDTAYRYEYNRFYAVLSRRLSNWHDAADRIFETPFVWIGSGTTRFEEARSPGYVEEQLQAARRWGMGRMFANFAYGELASFDYGPYETAMRAASEPGVVDAEPPELDVSGSVRIADNGRARLTGTATDNLAIRSIRWETDGGRSGSARMTWGPEPGREFEGSESGAASSLMRWSAPGVRLRPGRNSVAVTVEDIKGLTTRKVVQVRFARKVP